MMRVRALSILCQDEANDDGRGRVIELDVKVGSVEFSVAQLRAALKNYFHPARRAIFSRRGVWRGPLHGLPKSTLLPLPPPNAVLEVVVLPSVDDGSLALALARAQLSVPRLRNGTAFFSRSSPGNTPAPALVPELAPAKAAAGLGAESEHSEGGQNGDLVANATVTASSASKPAKDGKKDEEKCKGKNNRSKWPDEETWGLEIDVVEILAESGPPRGPRERQRLAKAMLRAGDADRLLLCLGRLEGEAPRGPPGGRADAFDDPAAVAERDFRRRDKKKSCQDARLGQGVTKEDVTKEVPLWTPPFPPEEFDDYDEGFVSEGQEFGMNQSLAGASSHFKGRRRACDGRDGKRHAPGQQESAELLEALRRLLEALGDVALDDDPTAEVPAAAEDDDGRNGGDDCESKGTCEEGEDSRQERSSTEMGASTAASGVHRGDTDERLDCEKTAGCDCDVDSDGDGDRADDDFTEAAAALESSCLRSVCRQYMFGVDWRFISAHGHFYLALLKLLIGILRPIVVGPESALGRRRGWAVNDTKKGEEAKKLLANFLLAPSADCRGLVELLECLCVGLDDLVAVPSESAATPVPPPPVPPTRLAHPVSLSPSPAMAHNPPPSPASPTPLTTIAQQQSNTSSKIAAAAAAAAAGATGAAAGIHNPSPPHFLPNHAHPSVISAIPPLASPPWQSGATITPAPTPSAKAAGQKGLPPLVPIQAEQAISPSLPGWTSLLPPSKTVPTFGPPVVSPAAPGGAAPPAELAVSPGGPGWTAIPPPPPLPQAFKPASAPPASNPVAPGGGAGGVGSSQGSGAGLGLGTPTERYPWGTAQQREALEHEQGTALAKLARSVLAQAKAVAPAPAPALDVPRIDKIGGAVSARSATIADGNVSGNGAAEVTANGGVTKLGGDEAGSEVMTPEGADEEPSEEALYVDAMAGLQFDTMRMEVVSPGEDGVARSDEDKADQEPQQQPQQQQPRKPRQRHHFWGVAEAEGPVPSTRQRRLVRELRSLARELPLYWGSTIAVRVDEDRPHLLKAMIAAPEDTPYDSGLFEFDVYCPPQYPAVPPRVNLMTTGRGRVRFSPNLYACGNVCLSLLGTWSGSPEMMWSSNASLLQVLLSLQTFILGAQYPYFNEPGVELDFGHDGAMDRARTSPNGGYEVLRPSTVEWAMTEALRFPPRGFEAFAREHLWRKKWHILGVMGDWLREAKRPGGLVGHYRDLVASLQGLLKELIRLSASMGDCRYSPPPPPPPHPPHLLPSLSWAEIHDAVDPRRAEYFAARRGLFGAEAGPPSNDQKKSARYGGGDGGAGECKGGEEGPGDDVNHGLSDSANERPSPAGDEPRRSSSSPTKHELPLRRRRRGRHRPRQRQRTLGGGVDDDDDEEEEEEESPLVPTPEEKNWESPAEARERLEFRLQVAVRARDVATAAAAAAADTMTRVGARRPEAWVTVAGRAARAAGVGALHGKALPTNEAKAGGQTGVTWSTHPQFLKYFMLLRLGVPREEVIAKAVRSGVDPSILDHPDEKIPLDTQYSVASPCAPLLRVSPDLDSVPVAQLTTASGTIYTAKPTRTLGSSRPSRPSATATGNAIACQSPDDATVLTRAPSAIKGEECGNEKESSPAYQTASKPDPEAGGGSSQSVSPSEHPLVLSGRRVWVVSPVVGWASVWTETGQIILSPAGADGESGGNGNSVGSGPGAADGKRGPKKSQNMASAGGVKGKEGGDGEGVSDAGSSVDVYGTHAAAGFANSSLEVAGMGKNGHSSSGPLLSYPSFPPSPLPPLDCPSSQVSSLVVPADGYHPSQQLPKGVHNHLQPWMSSPPSNASGTNPSAALKAALVPSSGQSMPPKPSWVTSPPQPPGTAQIHDVAPAAGPLSGAAQLAAFSATDGLSGWDKKGFMEAGPEKTAVQGGGGGMVGGVQMPHASSQWGGGAGENEAFGAKDNDNDEAKKTE